MFDFIQNIYEDSVNQKSNLFLTIDVDWASEEVIEYTHDLLLEYDVKSTWFVTHPSKKISQLMEDTRIDLGIHPNFNDLLEGNLKKSVSIEDKIKQLLDFTNGAKAVRSHSMTQNSRILDIFAKLGLTHDCNHYIPYSAGVQLKSWTLWNGLVKVPFFWEDDLDISSSNEELAKKLLMQDGLRVFNFHPIHVFLNTQKLSTYEQAKPFAKNPSALKEFRHGGYGTENFLRELIENHLNRSETNR